MQIEVAQQIDIDVMVALDALVSGSSCRRHLITETVEQHHGYVARQENQIVGLLLMQMQRLCERLNYIRSGIVENQDEDDSGLFYFNRLTHEARFR